MARGDSSPVVRRRIASAIQRLKLSERWPWLESLAARNEDANDQNIPFLLWYALEPAAAAEPSRALALVQKTQHTRLVEFTARRLAAAAFEPGVKGAPLEEVCQLLGSGGQALRAPLLAGLKAGFAGLTRVAQPSAWRAAYTVLSADSDAGVRRTARELAVLFGSADARNELLGLLGSEQAALPERSEALGILSRLRDPASQSLITSLAGSPGPLRKAALGALASYGDDGVSPLLIGLLPGLKPEERNEALNTLLARPSGARALLSAIDAGLLKKDVVSAPIARKIEGFKDAQLTGWIEKNWGRLNESSYVKRGNIDHVKKFLDDESVLRADLKRGRELFRTSCGLCHQMFGTGGDIGPHLTGGYTDLEYLLQNIIDPNAVIGKDYQLVYITLKDGSLHAGIVAAENATSVTLKAPGALAPVVIAKDQIKSREVSANSLMPEGLLNGLEEPDVRSLFLYLRQTAEPQ
jgi:putative heme-binding domain-containing protein